MKLPAFYLLGAIHSGNEPIFPSGKFEEYWGKWNNFRKLLLPRKTYEYSVEIQNCTVRYNLVLFKILLCYYRCKQRGDIPNIPRFFPTGISSRFPVFDHNVPAGKIWGKVEIFLDRSKRTKGICNIQHVPSMFSWYSRAEHWNAIMKIRKEFL